MRTVSESYATKKFGKKRMREVWEDGDPDIKTVDWRESVSEVLKEVDRQLAPFGLEVCLHDTGDDNYVWHIEPADKNRKIEDESDD